MDNDMFHQYDLYQNYFLHILPEFIVTTVQVLILLTFEMLIILGWIIHAYVLGIIFFIFLDLILDIVVGHRKKRLTNWWIKGFWRK